MACNVCLSMEKKESKNSNYTEMTDEELFNAYSKDPNNQEMLAEALKRPEMRKKILNNFDNNVGKIATLILKYQKTIRELKGKLEDTEKAFRKKERECFRREKQNKTQMKRIEELVNYLCLSIQAKTLQNVDTQSTALLALLNMDLEIEKFNEIMEKKKERDKKERERKLAE